MKAEERAKKYLSEYGLLALFIQESKLAREFDRLENEVREAIRDELILLSEDANKADKEGSPICSGGQNEQHISVGLLNAAAVIYKHAAEIAMTAPRKD